MKKENNKTVNLCIFSNYGYSLYNKRSDVLFGGAEVQLFLLANQLVKDQKIKVHIIIGKKEFQFNKIETYNDIKLYVSIPVEKSIINYIKGGINLFLTLLKLNPDVIIQRTGGIQTFLIALYSQIFRKKFIFSIAHERAVSKRGFSRLIQPFFNLSLNYADFIVTQNKDQLQLFKQWRGRKFNKVKTIKSGYEIEDKELNLKNKESILWVGRAKRWKRPELFLKIAKLFPKESFVMICKLKENDEYSDSIFQEAELIKNLKFIKFVPFNNIDVYFQKAKVLINTSSKEGFPNTFIQAIKNKTPLISLNVDPEHFIEDYKCGFFCNDDIRILKKKLNNLLNNKKFYKELSNNCFKYAKENHDIKKTAGEWRDLIFKIAQINIVRIIRKKYILHFFTFHAKKLCNIFSRRIYLIKKKKF